MKSIIIRGPLGVGKSTVARAVAENIGGIYISVDQVLEEYGLDKASDGEGIPLENFLKANELLLQETKQARKEGKPLIVDGNFYHKEQIEQLVQALGNETIAITLKAPVETCLVRDAGREKPYGEDATRVVHMFVSAFDFGTVIDTENQTMSETIQAVMDIIQNES